MSFLKGLALSLLLLLLFLSLSVFGLAFMLNITILNPDFVVSELNRIDVPLLVEELFSQQVAQQQGGEFMLQVLDETVTELEPWIKEQVSDGVYSSYDYLVGRSQNLSVIISTEPVTDSLRSNLREALLTSPPPEIAGLPPALIEQYFNEYYRQISESIPPTLEFTESSLSPDDLATLEQVKQYISYFQLGYKVLIGFMVALVLGIIFINRDVRRITRGLGIIFLTYGAFEYAGIFVTRRFVVPQIPLTDVPLSLQAWLLKVVSKILFPLEMLSLGLLIGGVVLLIVSFIYKPRQPSS